MGQLALVMSVPSCFVPNRPAIVKSRMSRNWMAGENAEHKLHKIDRGVTYVGVCHP